MVEFGTLQGRHRRILHEQFFVIALADRFAGDCILISILHAEGICVGALVGFERVVIKGRGNRVMNRIALFCEINGSPNIANLFDRNPTVEQFCQTQKDLLAHAVGKNIGATVDKD